MPTVSDYCTIVGSNESVHIGDGGEQVWEDTFGTGGRDTGQRDVHILTEYKGLHQGSVAEVLINDTQSGKIFGHQADVADDRHTTIISFPDERLKNGVNEIQINAVENDSTPGTYDDFVIENMVCMFHQRA